MSDDFDRVGAVRGCQRGKQHVGHPATGATDPSRPYRHTPTNRAAQRAGPGEAPASQLPRTVGTPQRRASKIGMRLRLVEHHYHGWLLLHRSILATGPAAGKGPVVLNPEPRTGQTQAVRPARIKSARTPRNQGHHAVDGTDSTRPRIETSRSDAEGRDATDRLRVDAPGVGSRTPSRCQPDDARRQYKLANPAARLSRRTVNGCVLVEVLSSG
jgi:hypothetical protein